MASVFAAVDCGTSAVKAGLFNAGGGVLALESRPVACDYGAAGRIGQDARRLRRAAFDTLATALRRCGVAPASVAALCITHQRATILATDQRGEPVAPAMSWQDRRGEAVLRRVRIAMGDRRYTRLTGLPLSPVFSIGKVLQWRREQGGRWGPAQRFLLLQDFLLRAFGVDDFVCDRSNASLTGWFDIRSGDWSDPLLNLMRLPRSRLSALVDPGQVVGTVSASAARQCGLLAGTPLVAGAGDQQCAGIGSGVVARGIGAITLGTAGVIMVFCGQPVTPGGGLLCTVHGVPGAWCLEGLQPAAFDSLHWVLQRLGRSPRLDPAFERAVAAVPAGADGVLFWPYLAGSGAPDWDTRARAAWLGLRHAHNAATLSRAALEGVAFEQRVMLDALIRRRAGPRELRINGGGSTLELWNRIQASVYRLPVRTLREPQASLLGAAVLGAVGVGAHGSVHAACRRMVRVKDTFLPVPQWQRAYRRTYRRYLRLGALVREATRDLPPTGA